jgi:hypothetical protein
MKTKYQPDFPERAKKMAEEGLLDEQIWEQLGIGKVAFYDYQNTHPNFANALKEGKRKPNEEVEATLFKSAVGYTVQERHVELDAQQKPKKIIVIDKHVPGNVVAQIFWLKNRMRERWRDVREITAQVTGGPPQLPEDMPDEELEIVTANLKRLMPNLFNGKQHAGKN